MGWHPGERAIQERVGVTDVADSLLGAIFTEIPPLAEDFLRDQPWLLLGAQDEHGQMWATALYGLPGFADVRDPRTVHIDALPAAGDPLAEVLADEAEIGLLAIDPPTRSRMRLNGHSSPAPGGIVVHSEQVYPNCPKYISARRAKLVGDGSTPRDAAVSRGTKLSADQRKLLKAADTFFIATRAPGHGTDVSHRGGTPGFVVVEDGRRLTWPDYHGNSIFNTLGNISLDPHTGLLFIDFERGDMLQLTGRAEVVWDPERIAAFPRAERLVDFEIDAVVHQRGAAGLHWSFESPSKLNPPVPVLA